MRMTFHLLLLKLAGSKICGEENAQKKSRLAFLTTAPYAAFFKAVGRSSPVCEFLARKQESIYIWLYLYARVSDPVTLGRKRAI